MRFLKYLSCDRTVRFIITSCKYSLHSFTTLWFFFQPFILFISFILDTLMVITSPLLIIFCIVLLTIGFLTYIAFVVPCNQVILFGFWKCIFFVLFATICFLNTMYSYIACCLTSAGHPPTFYVNKRTHESFTELTGKLDEIAAMSLPIEKDYNQIINLLETNPSMSIVNRIPSKLRCSKCERRENISYNFEKQEEKNNFCSYFKTCILFLRFKSLFSEYKRQTQEEEEEDELQHHTWELDQKNNQFEIVCLKPPRTHHCSTCDKCILRMDHHCPWINRCVGSKNHRFFFLFLLWLTLTLLLADIAFTPPAISKFFELDEQFISQTRILEDYPSSSGYSAVVVLKDENIYEINDNLKKNLKKNFLNTFNLARVLRLTHKLIINQAVCNSDNYSTFTPCIYKQSSIRTIGISSGTTTFSAEDNILLRDIYIKINVVVIDARKAKLINNTGELKPEYIKLTYSDEIMVPSESYFLAKLILIYIPKRIVDLDTTLVFLWFLLAIGVSAVLLGFSIFHAHAIANDYTTLEFALRISSDKNKCFSNNWKSNCSFFLGNSVFSLFPCILPPNDLNQERKFNEEELHIV